MPFHARTGFAALGFRTRNSKMLVGSASLPPCLDGRCVRAPSSQIRNSPTLHRALSEASGDFLEGVSDPRGRQLIRSEPPAEIGEGSYDRRKSGTDQCESCQRAGPVEARPLQSNEKPIPG